MNAIFQLVFSTFLLVQLGAAAFIPFQKLMNQKRLANHRTLATSIFNNYVDDYELENTDEVLTSSTCDYYDYKDDCHNSNDGCAKQTETCTYSSTNSACYVVWRGGKKLLQGCWAPSDRLDCTPGACVTDQGLFSSKLTYEGTYFCCCFGDKCNQNYGLTNNIPAWQ